ncbi:hypothetical protein NMY22_g3848 [Coprinellus aureogranulatus]|nr:hypothetical protein NMY22_g3848 [Coprinellus aureogranulatus]
MSQLAAIESRIATLRIAKAETWKLYNDQKKEFLALGRARRALIQANSTTVRDFPTEVLSKIFEAAICVKDFDHKTDIQRNVLRRVCSRWNEIILAEPKFWTNIFIQLVEEDVVYDNEEFDQPILCCTQKEAFNRVRMRMKRGGDLLKHLRLVHPCLQPDPLDSAEPPPPELAKLLRQVKNWGSVYIDLEEYFDFVFEIFNSDSPDPSPRAVWPHLESLELRTSVDLVPPGMEDVDILLPDDIENHFATSPKARVTATAFPSLKHVSLDLGKRNLLQWDLPWSQLTSLRLKCFANPVFIYLGILEKCPSLEDLYILADLPNHARCLPSSADFKSRRPVTLPRLRSLTLIAKVKCDLLETLVPRLVLPCLESFRYETYVDRDVPLQATKVSTTALNHIKGLIRGSGCSLRSLTLKFYQAMLDDLELERLLAMIPTLRALIISAQRITCNFLGALATRPLEHEALEHIELDNLCHSDGVDPQPNFAEYVRRWAEQRRGRKERLHASLVTIIPGIHRWDPEGTEDMRRKRVKETMKDLFDRGFKVAVTEIV